MCGNFTKGLSVQALQGSREEQRKWRPEEAGQAKRDMGGDVGSWALHSGRKLPEEGE